MIGIENDRLKSVISDMRKQMEEYIEKDDRRESKQPPTISEATLQLAEQQVHQANEYIELLQSRLGMYEYIYLYRRNFRILFFQLL
jgi:hypothetical protein